MNTNRQGDWIQTVSGEKFYPLDPDPTEIHIEDIGHALAYHCRFAGHTRDFYSVAQHSVIVSQEVEERAKDLVHGVDLASLALAALLHDASEAYILDLPRPLKHLSVFAFYREAEDRLQKAVLETFDLGLSKSAEQLIKAVDEMTLVSEAHSFMEPLHPDWIHRRETHPSIDRVIRGLNPYLAELQFMERYEELEAKRGKPIARSTNLFGGSP